MRQCHPFLPAALLLQACFIGGSKGRDRSDDGGGGFNFDDGGTSDGGTSDSGTSDGGTSDGGTTEVDPDFTVHWASSAIQVSVSTGGTGWHFGLIEATDGCSSDCWTGEDCVYGYGSSYFYCHPLDGSASASLVYSGDYSDLDEGRETVFPDSSFSQYCAYYFEDDSGNCWIGGDGSSWYDGLGCTEVQILD